MSGYAQADPYTAQGTGGNLKMCRAAAVAQMAMGAIICLLAFCVLAVGAMVAGGVLPAEQQQELAEVTSQLGNAAGILFVVTGICVGLPGLGQIILGFFVWRGSKVGLVLSMVVDGLFGALMLLNLATLLSSGGVGNPAGLCVNTFMLAMVAGLFALLVMAHRESSAFKAAKLAYEAQWQQYYQQQYQYQAALQQQAANAAHAQQPGMPTPPPPPAEPGTNPPQSPPAPPPPSPGAAPEP